MVRVEGRFNENVEKLIRRFKKACEKEGISKHGRETLRFEKPSQKKRRKLVAARRAQQKNEMKKPANARRGSK